MQAGGGSKGRDLLGGLILVLLGTGTVALGGNYGIGALSHMGAGFFPVALGSILVLCGVAIAVAGSLRPSTGRADRIQPEWRGWACIIGALLAFAFIGRYGGLVPATFAITFIAALGDRENSIRGAVLLALAMVAVCLVVFVWGLGVRFSLFTWGQA